MIDFADANETASPPGTVPPRGAGTVLVAACPMPLLTNTVSGRRSFHKQSPEFCIECHTATILAGRIEFIDRVSSNTIRRDSLYNGLPFYMRRWLR